MSSYTRLPTLRLVTCGSVDDGKSTLIGRLLYEAGGIFNDELRALAVDSRQHGTQGDRVDLALLMDGLQAEREQGITIDVAYRYFATARRKFIIADTPGHEQYTRNTATGASTAQLAIILVDVRKGILTQTRRHTRIVAMMGIDHVILAVNKMDLVGYRERAFNVIADSYAQFAKECGVANILAIPISALEGDNVTRASAATPWYRGPTLLEHLETVETSRPSDREDFRLPVQWINRPNSDFRGICGRIASGAVAPGDRVVVLPAGTQTEISRIVTWDGDRTQAAVGDSVELTLVGNVDVSRGDVLSSVQSPPSSADQFEARLLWMGEQVMVPKRPYRLKMHYKEVTAMVTSIKHQEDVDTGMPLAATKLSCNDIGLVTLTTAQPLVFEAYRTNRTLGAFILIDKLTLETVGAGMIKFALRRANNIPWQALAIDKNARALQKQQKPCCIWFTGLSGAGKSTIANGIEQRLSVDGRHTYILDGDNLRHGLNRDLGFTVADRVENVRRVAEVARLMVDAGLIVLVSLISPFRAERKMARDMFGLGEFIEVFVDTPLQVCEARDRKGLYGKARRGELPNFTGIDSSYDRPENPEVHLHPEKQSIEECVAAIIDRMS